MTERTITDAAADVPVFLCSLDRNELSMEGSKAIAEAIGKMPQLTSVRCALPLSE